MKVRSARSWLGWIFLAAIALSWRQPLAAEPPPSPKLILRAADECQNMPPSLNPYGDRCAKEVAKRWTACWRSNQGHAAALDDCLGFKRPEPLSFLDSLKERELEAHSVDGCSYMPNPMGAACPQEVRERIARCGPAAIRHEISSRAFANCLGFAIPDPPPVATLAACERPHVHVQLSIRVAHDTVFPRSRPRVVGRQHLQVADRPVIDERDIDRLRVEIDGGWRQLRIDLSPAAARRFAKASAADVGQYIVVDLDGNEVAMRLEAAIPGGQLLLRAGDRPASDFCR